MNALRQTLNTLRWRLIPVRYAGKIARSIAHPRLPSAAPAPTLPGAVGLAREGHAPGPTIPAETVAAMQAIYRPRAAQVVPTETGHPFTNLFRVEDIDAANPVFAFAVSPGVLDVASDYYGGRILFDSIQVLYSFPTSGALRESQMWHKDFGDSKSFHCVAYLNDVLDDTGGPFGYVDRADTGRIASSPFIRRISDEQFAHELGDGTVRKFYGHAGESVFIDPSACYHYGSRCVTPRMAIFVTFNTDRPFVAGQRPIVGNEAHAAAEAIRLRPDLDPDHLRRIFNAA
ncbi:MAG: hypothetical protein V4537_16435 [Pseudomonadota bacterium]